MLFQGAKATQRGRWHPISHSLPRQCNAMHRYKVTLTGVFSTAMISGACLSALWMVKGSLLATWTRPSPFSPAANPSLTASASSILAMSMFIDILVGTTSIVRTGRNCFAGYEPSGKNFNEICLDRKSNILT